VNKTPGDNENKTSDQGIVRVGRGEEQPKDKERAQTATKTEPGQIFQPVPKEEEPRGS
jgi:hypothetical protein